MISACMVLSSWGGFWSYKVRTSNGQQHAEWEDSTGLLLLFLFFPKQCNVIEVFEFFLLFIFCKRRSFGDEQWFNLTNTKSWLQETTDRVASSFLTEKWRKTSKPIIFSDFKPPEWLL